MSIDRNTFESIYAGQPRWEIGRPQKAFTDVADQLSGRFSIPAAGLAKLLSTSPVEATRLQASTSFPSRFDSKTEGN